MKIKILIIVSVIMSFSCFFHLKVFAATTAEAQQQIYNLSVINILGLNILQKDIPRRGLELLSLLRKGLERESVNAWTPALAAYDQCILISQTVLNSDYANKMTSDYSLPFSIGITFRKALVSNKYISGSVVSLYKQLQMYEDVDRWVNEGLTTISNLRLEKDIRIPDTQISPLLFARSYNRVAWGYSLMSGNTWKRYIVYPPSDIVSMISKSMADLKQIMSYYGLSYANSNDEINRKIDSYFSGPLTLSEDLTLRIVYNAKTLDIAKDRMKNQFTNNIKKTLEIYYSQPIVNSLQNGKDICVFEDILRPEAKDLLSAISTVLNQMDL